MTRQEFSQLAAAIRTYYPHSNVLPNKAAMELWYAELKDMDYVVVTEVVREHARTVKWAPTIAEIIAGQDAAKKKLYIDALESKLLYGTTENDMLIERYLIEQRG